MCHNRLLVLQKRFKNNPELYGSYNEIFQEQLNLDTIEKVPTELENEEGTEFMPHHGVVRVDRETTRLKPWPNALDRTPAMSSIVERRVAKRSRLSFNTYSIL